MLIKRKPKASVYMFHKNKKIYQEVTIMFGFGFGFREINEVNEVKESRPANKTFYNKINKEVENIKGKMTDEEWEQLLQDLDRPLFK